MLTELLIECYMDDRGLFLIDMNTQENIRNNYQCFNTFGRTSDTRALKMKASESDVDKENTRWKRVGQSI